MSKIKKIFIWLLILILLVLNGIAIYNAFSPSKNSGAIIIICIATTCVLSVFIKFILMYIKRKNNE